MGALYLLLHLHQSTFTVHYSVSVRCTIHITWNKEAWTYRVARTGVLPSASWIVRGRAVICTVIERSLAGAAHLWVSSNSSCWYIVRIKTTVTTVTHSKPLVSKASRNHLNEEITPLLPTGIGERYSQTISNLGHAALLTDVTPPVNESAEVSQGAL